MVLMNTARDSSDFAWRSSKEDCGQSVDAHDADLRFSNGDCRNDAANLSVLLAVLARTFAYPSVDEALDLVDMESIEYCAQLLESVGLTSPSFDGIARRCHCMTLLAGHGYADENDCMGSDCMPADKSRSPGADALAREFRCEMSRLFYSPLCPMRLEGRYWIPRQARCSQSRILGERASIALAYREHGLRLRPGNSSAEDALQNELDFVSLLARREAAALLRGKVSEAIFWKEERRRFYAHHMRDFIAGVTDYIAQNSISPFLTYYAETLVLASDRIAG